MLDFSDTGVLDVFVDEAHADARSRRIGGKDGTPPGPMRGFEFANTCSRTCARTITGAELRRRQLPEGTQRRSAFDLLCTGTATRPACRGRCASGICATRIRKNRLRELRQVTRPAANQSTLSRVDAPTFIYGSREDHIVPWHVGGRVGAAPYRAAETRTRRFGSYRGRHQPAGEEQARLLDLSTTERRDVAGGLRRLARKRDGKHPGSCVALPGPLGLTAIRREEDEEAARAPGRSSTRSSSRPPAAMCCSVTQ